MNYKLILIFLILSLKSFAVDKGGLAIVLSGGGARGFSQIGVLKAFEEEGIYPDHIIGTSIGAIIGGLYASGYSADELDSIARSTDWNSLLGFSEVQDRTKKLPDQKSYFDRNLIRFRFDNFQLVLPESISKGFPIRYFLQNLIWKAPFKTYGKFSELKYNFRAVATDLYSTKTVALDSGNLVNSILASSAIPLRYPTVTIDSMILVDGGVKANIPVASAFDFSPDKIIAVNTTSPLRDFDDLNSPIAIADQVISILMKDIADSLAALSDIVIKPNIGSYSNSDFSNLDSLIEQGYIAAKQAIRKYALNKISDAQKRKLKYKFEEKISNNFPELQNEFNSRTEAIKFLIQQGYNFAVINEEELLDVQTAILKVDLGRIEEVNINSMVSSFLIRRELKFSKGDFANVESLNESYENLMSTGLFKNIDIEIDKLSKGISININATENPSQNLLLGFRIDNYRNTQAGVDIYNDNLLNTGGRVGLRIAGGNLNQEIDLLLENPRIFSSILSSKINLYYSNFIFERYDLMQVSNKKFELDFQNNYNIERYGATFRLGGLISRIGLLSMTYRYENQRSFIERDSADEFKTLSTIKLGSKIDSQDDIDFPTKGVFFNIFLESNVFSDPEIQFTKFYTKFLLVQNYERHYLKPSLELGIADRNLPSPEYFNLGGLNSFFGMHQIENRGRQIFRTSLEYNYKMPFQLFFDTYISIRYDLGNTWIEPEEIKLAGLRHGAGLGLLFDTPLGPAKFAIARSFYFISEPNSTVTGPLLFYFSIGTSISEFDL